MQCDVCTCRFKIEMRVCKDLDLKQALVSPSSQSLLQFTRRTQYAFPNEPTLLALKARMEL
jgi:hypothetical protein